MTDEAFLFSQTEKERKRNGRGAFNKKRQGGKTIRFPSDHLTKKEREKMNGECKVYRLKEPVGWEEFNSWPDDIQKQYLQQLMESYGVGTRDLAGMFGVGVWAIQQKRRDLGMATHRGGRKTTPSPEWEVFLGHADRLETVEPPEEETPAAQEDTGAIKVQVNGQMYKLYELMLALAGTGAKLTIEVTL